jgi:Fe-S oxidoreductase
MYLENVIEITDYCRYCLMCRHVASVERVTYKETLSPHGWALVIASVRRGLLKWDADTVEVIYSAPDHGNSRAHCVFDNPLPEAIAAARAEVVGLKLAPAIVYELDEAFQRWGTPFAKQEPQPVTGSGEVALFVGDEAHHLWPGAIPAVLQLLKTLGVEPVLIGVGRSNGYLASSLGLPETAGALAREIQSEINASGAKQVLVLSPGDFFTLKQLYDERLGFPWPEELKLEEVTTFLDKRLEGGELKLRRSKDEIAYAYVDPTHSVRAPARHDAPRRLLAATMAGAGHELFWRRERAHPVGSTALQFTRPDIAEKLTLARLEDGRQSGAQWLFCDDAGTLKQLSLYADRVGLRIQGLYEWLAQQLVT